jgi:hypothetical protein
MQSQRQGGYWMIPPPEITIWVHRRKIVRGGKKIDGYSANCDPRRAGGATSPDRADVVAHMTRLLQQSRPGTAIVVKDAP